MKHYRGCLIFTLVAGVIGLGILMTLGYRLVAPVPRTIGAPPKALGGKTITFTSDTGNPLVGWLTEAESDLKGAVLLLHSVRGDRRVMADRAVFLRDLGYHTLCIDFQAHGESPGKYITLGHKESQDTAASVKYLRQKYPGLPVGVIGTSLGGASALMLDSKGTLPEAMIIEGVFADVPTATKNRLEIRLSKPGRLLSPLLTMQTRLYLGVPAEQLSPLSAAAKIAVPVLVMVGEEDRHATPDEALKIYEALGGEKEFWMIKGAAHVDLHRYAGKAYEDRVGEFLQQNLSLK